MTRHAVVPVKAIDQAKSRLGPVLTAAQRHALVIQMLRRVVHALEQCGAEITLATGSYLPDFPQIRQIVDPDADLNASVDFAVETLSLMPGDILIVIAADLPQLASREVDELIDAALRHGIAIAPDAGGRGTNAFATRAPIRLPAAFGLGSSERHRRSARELGYEPWMVKRPGLAHDIDEPESLRRWSVSFPSRPASTEADAP